MLFVGRPGLYVRGAILNVSQTIKPEILESSTWALSPTQEGIELYTLVQKYAIVLT
jgi:hypothetical protein